MPILFRITSTPGPVIDYLVATLTQHLDAGERVLWLVPGGSAIQVAAAVAGRLRATAYPSLVVTLTDERYGEPGHADSNWRQLTEAGFTLPGATLLPVLQDGATLDATAGTFARTLEGRLSGADYAIGLFGIGPDGHIAGILPHSPAVMATALALGYDARTLPPVTPGGPQYQRITATPPAVTRLHEAVVYATGEAKWSVLDDLAGTSGHHKALSDQPAQVLQQIHQVTVYNDHKGDPA